jgi:IS605 OrfB family transposase
MEAKAAGQDVVVPWTLFELRREWNQASRGAAPAPGVEADRHHVTLPRIGRIRTRESTRKLARRVEQGSARVMTATATRTGDRWFVSLTCEVKRAIAQPRRPRATIGVDVGIRHLAVLSDGRLVPNPAPLRRAQRRLRRLNRQLARRHGPWAADGSRRNPSAGWHQTRRRLAREHARVANVRHNGLHQLTTELVDTYGTIVIERLNVAGLMKNRRLAGRLADASLGKLRRQLTYKSFWAGSALIEAGRFFPSSKICSGCGQVKAKLPLSERQYHCECCGIVLDRDVNAARNLAVLVALSANGVAGSGPETGNARGWGQGLPFGRMVLDEAGSRRRFRGVG